MRVDRGAPSLVPSAAESSDSLIREPVYLQRASNPQRILTLDTNIASAHRLRQLLHLRLQTNAPPPLPPSASLADHRRSPGSRNDKPPRHLQRASQQQANPPRSAGILVAYLSFTFLFDQTSKYSLPHHRASILRVGCLFTGTFAIRHHAARLTSKPSGLHSDVSNTTARSLPSSVDSLTTQPLQPEGAPLLTRVSHDVSSCLPPSWLPSRLLSPCRLSRQHLLPRPRVFLYTMAAMPPVRVRCLRRRAAYHRRSLHTNAEHRCP